MNIIVHAGCQPQARSRVRVLHPITRLIVGGAQETALDIAQGLPPEKFQVEMLAGPQSGPEGSLIEESHRRGIALHILPSLVRQVSPIQDLRALVALTRRIRSGGYVIVHTHSSKAGILGRLAARLAGTPIVVHTVHGWSFHDFMSPLRRWAYIAAERLCARYTDTLMVVAEADIAKGLAAGIGTADQYQLVRSAIPLHEFDPSRVDRRAARTALALPDEALVVGNVGRLSVQKNPLEWVAAAARIAAHQPRARFLLVGDGPLRADVESALERSGLRERTVLTGLRRDVPALLAAMDLFLLTSRWEGLPRVLPQAMAMRLPVVASRADGTAEAVQHGITGYLCTPGDVDALAGCCLRLLADPEARRAMGEKGRQESLANFDIQVMLRDVEGVYEQLLGSRRAAVA